MLTIIPVVPDIASLIKNRRLSRNWSLRQLGSQIGVTPAYIADLEAGRRLPSAELKARLATVLEIPAEELAAADSRLTPDLRDWIEERPPLTALLRSLRESPEPDMLINRWPPCRQKSKAASAPRLPNHVGIRAARNRRRGVGLDHRDGGRSVRPLARCSDRPPCDQGRPCGAAESRTFSA